MTWRVAKAEWRVRFELIWIPVLGCSPIAPVTLLHAVRVLPLSICFDVDGCFFDNDCTAKRRFGPTLRDGKA